MTQTPDHVPCRHCGVPISWDETCWTHDNTGFADCGLTVRGGTPVRDHPEVVMNPTLTVEGPHKGKHAEPVGEWT
jgi:hypothetical protein